MEGLFNKGEFIAKKNKNDYIIWTKNYWIGTFYPIFKINFNSNGEITKIGTELSLNGKLWRIILGALLLSFFVFLLIIPIIENFENIDFTVLIIIGVFGFLGFGVIWVFKKNYENETKNLLNELKIAVGLDSKKTVSKKKT